MFFMTESLFHSGCTVITLPLCLDNETLSTVATEELLSVFYELKRFIWGSQHVAMQLHYYICMCNCHLYKMAAGNKLLLGENACV